VRAAPAHHDLTRAAAAVALGAGLLAVLSLPHLGVTIDEPALFYAGDRTLYAVTHPTVPGALNYDAPDPAGFHSAFPRLPAAGDPERYPVLPGLVAAATNATIGRALGLNPVDGHHLGLLLLSAATLFLFTRLAGRLLGPAAGIAAGVALACFPTAVGHFANDAKDWPCAMFYALAILSAGVGVLEGDRRQIWMASIWVGLALSCKQSGVFAIATLAVGAPALWPFLRAQPRLRTPLLLLPWIAGAIFLVAWPWLWWGGPRAFPERLGGFLAFSRAFATSSRAGFSAHPLRCLLAMTPPIVLGAAALGAWPGRGADRRRRAIAVLLASWLLLPLLRIALPHAAFYDANRHFIEYVPALCAMAGVGFVEGWRRAQARASRRIAGGVTIVAGLMLVLPIVMYHPYDTAYFNVFAGGLGGAQRRALFREPDAGPSSWGTEGDYWSSGLRDAVRAARAMAPAPAPVGVCAWEPELAALDAGEPLGNVTADAEHADGVVIVSPRYGRCSWARVRELERTRPMIRRVERGGGLIYEVLGPRDAVARAPVSPATSYD
jgi:Dolichyl-phosphate-mannose-protein mannosyltransferase